ncbi:MAG: response regulator [Candidatus Hodarchaeales archaeon]
MAALTGIIIMLVLLVGADTEIMDHVSLAVNICLSDCQLITHDSSRNCLKIVKDKCPDLVILDIDTIKDRSFNLIKKIKLYSDIPVMGLSSAMEIAEEIKAFEMGIDAYIKKPFYQLELMARIRALLRRSQQPNSN